MKPNSLLVLTLASALGVPAFAGELKEAHITQIYNQVQTLDPGQAARPAILHEAIHGDTAVHTGLQSRSELVFTDNTVTRLGSNTYFSFRNGTRDMNLKNGTILLQVPKHIGGAKITTAAVTAAITGTTIMWEVLPGNRIKFIVLEGSARLYLNNKKLESIVVNAGQMVILPANPTSMMGISPIDIDIERLVDTSLLISGMNNSHRITPFTLGPVNPTIKQQLDLYHTAELLQTNLMINGAGSNVLIVQDIASNARQPSPTPTPSQNQATSTPTPVPNPLPVINNVDMIDGSTKIVTDPTISRLDQQGQGAIYRGQAQDGLFSEWAFGSTVPLDSYIEYGSNTPSTGVTAYKFSRSLLLSGDPQLSIANGPKWVAFVSEGSINAQSGEAGVSFEGLEDVQFVSLNGSITLGSGIFFQHSNSPFDLSFYERNGDLTSDSSFDMSNTNLTLIASRDLDISSGPMSVKTALLVAGRDASFSSDAQFNGKTLDMIAGRDLSIAGRVTATNLFLNAGRNIDLSQAPSVGITATNMEFNAGGKLRLGGNLFNLSGKPVQQAVANTIDVVSSFNIPAGGIFDWTAGAGGIQASGFDLYGFHSLTTLNGGQINAQNILAKTINATGDVNVTNDLSVKTLATTGNVNAGTIFQHPVSGQARPSIPVPTNTYDATIITANHVTANIGGIEFDGDGGTGFAPGGNGGTLTLNITGADVTFGKGIFPTISGLKPAFVISSGINGAFLNGGDGAVGSDFPDGGNGGSLTVNSAGTINVNQSIQATTGQPAVEQTSGKGGKVVLNAGSTINVNDQVIVSSGGDGQQLQVVAGPAPASFISPTGPVNSFSDSGGTIKVHSRKASGVAININSTGQLLSLLDSTAAGPGGKITVTSAGGNININGARIEADGHGGTVLVQNNGAGSITVTNALLAGDVVKARVLGTNGSLTINGGTISADTTLKLYAQGSNGKIIFAADTVLAGNSAKTIAANTVTITNGKQVYVQGAAAANVYTNHANYNKTNYGNFTGAGAKTSSFGARPSF